MNYKLHALLPEVAAIFRHDEEFFLSEARDPSTLRAMSADLVHSFLVKWGYRLTAPLDMDPATWTSTINDLEPWAKPAESNATWTFDFAGHAMNVRAYGCPQQPGPGGVSAIWRATVGSLHRPKTLRLAVVGPRGVGKSSLLARLAQSTERLPSWSEHSGGIEVVRLYSDDRSVEIVNVDLATDSYVDPLREAGAETCDGFLYVTSYGHAADASLHASNIQAALNREVDGLRILGEWLAAVKGQAERRPSPWFLLIVCNKIDLFTDRLDAVQHHYEPARPETQASDFAISLRTLIDKLGPKRLRLCAVVPSCARLEPFKSSKGTLYSRIGERDRDRFNDSVLEVLATCIAATAHDQD